jgi:uncharacterized protein (TIGR02996 family)
MTLDGPSPLLEHASMSFQDPLSAFYLSLDQAPDDQVTLLALADWYEEQGDTQAAACLRWTVRRGLSPFRYRVGGAVTQSGQEWHDGWFWWTVDEPYFLDDWRFDITCRLPRPLWAQLRHSFAYEPGVFKQYPTRRSAYEALIEAWPMVDAQESEPVPQEVR